MHLLADFYRITALRVLKGSAIQLRLFDTLDNLSRFVD
jgi:hypothetical protein